MASSQREDIGRGDIGKGDMGTYAPIRKQGNAMFIINIKAKGNKGKFEFQTREGANEDSASLQMVFIETLGLKWINSDCHVDLTMEQWDHRKGEIATDFSQMNCKCMRCRISSMDHSQAKCFLLAISSHGREITETEIIFSDGNSILLTDIFEALSDNNCPTLAGKTRIIILQVCRSNFRDQERVLKMQDKGVPVTVEYIPIPETNFASGKTDTDAPETKGKKKFTVEPVEDNSLQQVALNKIPEHFLLVYPVVPGQKARRHVTDGSWLIHGMKKVVQEKYSSSDQTTKPVNFLKLLTEVAGYIAREKESIIYKRNENHSDEKLDTDWVRDEDKSGFKNAVCFHHRLVQPLIFYPKETISDLPNPF